MKKQANWHVRQWLDDQQAEHLFIAYLIVDGQIPDHKHYVDICQVHESLLYMEEKEWSDLSS